MNPAYLVVLSLVTSGIDPGEVLRRVAERVETNFSHTPKYTCVETVTRRHYRPEGGTQVGNSCAFQIQRPRSDRRLVTTDRLRLEVTMSGNGEIYSWLGASKFHEGDITEVIKRGPIATGAFGAALAMVFRGDGRNLTFQRAIETDGRTLLEFGYVVDANSSRYRVHTLLNGWFQTGYHGTVLANPVSGDVVSLLLATAELPPVTGACQTVASMDFSRQAIGEEQLLLPTTARQLFLGATGAATENTVSFSGCRAYSAESTVSFFEEPGDAGVPGANSRYSKLVGLPPNLRFTMELTTPIDTDTAAAGDPFQARLTEPLRDADQHVLAPRGALVEGRLLDVQVIHGSSPMTTVVLRPHSIEINHAKMPLTAYRFGASSPGERREIVLPQFWEPNAGIFRFATEHVKMTTGLISQWRTAAAPAP